MDTALEIEHIFARKRAVKGGKLLHPENLESLGNKALLEKRINIRASDYHFADKKPYYTGFVDSKQRRREGTLNAELRSLCEKDDFTEQDIERRSEAILNSFIDFLGENTLLREVPQQQSTLSL